MDERKIILNFSGNQIAWQSSYSHIHSNNQTEQELKYGKYKMEADGDCGGAGGGLFIFASEKFTLSTGKSCLGFAGRRHSTGYESGECLGSLVQFIQPI